MDTYVSAQKAYASQLVPGDPTSLGRAQLAAGLAVAAGLARVAMINLSHQIPLVEVEIAVKGVAEAPKLLLLDLK
jgi:hypothetical protein